MLNQFHDVLPGTSIEMVYQDSRTHYATVQRQTEDIIQNALQIITQNLQKGHYTQPLNEDSILLFNTLSWPRLVLVNTEHPFNDLVSQKTHSERFLQLVEVPSVGAIVLDASARSPVFLEVKLIEEGEFIVSENSFVRVSIGKDGRVCIISFIWSQIEMPFLPETQQTTLCCLTMFRSFGTPRDIMVYHLETRKELLSSASQVKLEILERGPLRACVQVTLPISEQSWISQTISLEPVLQLFDLTPKWNGTKLENYSKWNFQAQFEILLRIMKFSMVASRPTHFNTSWDLAKFEVCGHKWVDFSEYDFGLSILNDCKYSHSVHDNIVSLTLLKSPKAPDANCDIGRHQFSYGMLVHNKTFQDPVFFKELMSLIVPFQRVKSQLDLKFLKLGQF